MDNISKGRYGEEKAAGFLEKSGYKILEKNWRCDRGEIDIIAREGESIVFVEVKTRSTNFFPPAEAVDRRKQERLRKAALAFLQESKHSAAAYRFDVVTVDTVKNSIELWKHAF